jgi:hypothetical protein
MVGDKMKRVSIFAIAFLSASLTQVGLAQAGAPVNTDSSSQAKEKPSPYRQSDKDKAKTKPPIKADTGKKTTSSQDSAYALAYKNGTTQSSAA